jgi:hypothetical protein
MKQSVKPATTAPIIGPINFFVVERFDVDVDTDVGDDGGEVGGRGRSSLPGAHVQ